MHPESFLDTLASPLHRLLHLLDELFQREGLNTAEATVAFEVLFELFSGIARDEDELRLDAASSVHGAMWARPSPA